MDQTIINVGLPVKCTYGDCGKKGFVKPAIIDPSHGGWYKSRMFRFKHSESWFCPSHYEEGRAIDNRFYKNQQTPDPYTEQELQNQADTTEELYKLLD